MFQAAKVVEKIKTHIICSCIN